MKTKRKPSLITSGLAFVLGFILSQFTAVIGVVVIQTIMQLCGKTTAQIDTFFDGAWGYLIQALCMNVAFIIMFIWFYRKYLYKQEVVSKPNQKTYIYVLICVVIGVLTMFLVSGVLNYFELFVQKIGKSGATLSYELNSPKNYIISLISLALIPAVCEELFFRGVLLNSLKHKGYIFAVVVSAIMFSIYHFSLSQLIYPICFGLILGIVYLKTKNILFPMLMHFINNALSLSIQYFSSSSGEFTHSLSMLIYAFVTFAIWVTIMYYLFKNFKSHIKQNTLSENIQNPTTSQETESDTSSSNKTTSTQAIEQNTSLAKTTNLIFYGSIVLMLCVYILLICIG